MLSINTIKKEKERRGGERVGERREDKRKRPNPQILSIWHS